MISCVIQKTSCQLRDRLQHNVNEILIESHVMSPLDVRRINGFLEYICYMPYDFSCRSFSLYTFRENEMWNTETALKYFNKGIHSNAYSKNYKCKKKLVNFTMMIKFLSQKNYFC